MQDDYNTSCGLETHAKYRLNRPHFTIFSFNFAAKFFFTKSTFQVDGQRETAGSQIVYSHMEYLHTDSTRCTYSVITDFVARDSLLFFILLIESCVFFSRVILPESV